MLLVQYTVMFLPTALYLVQKLIYNSSMPLTFAYEHAEGFASLCNMNNAVSIQRSNFLNVFI